MTEGRDEIFELGAGYNEYKKFGVKVYKIYTGLSFGACFTHDKYAKECYLFIDLIKWRVSIGWLTFERK